MTRTTRHRPHPPLASVIPLRPASATLPRRRSGRRPARHMRRPTSVWICTPDPTQAGRAAGGWLPTAVSTAVATYTQPGHRVLLLTPPNTATDPGRADARPPAATGPLAKTGPDRDLDRLRRTADAVTSAGRLVTVRTAQRPPSRDPAPKPSVGPSPDPDPNRVDTAVAADTRTEPRQSDQRDRPDQPDLVITCVRPYATEWFAGMPWTHLIASRGLLAVITHSDIRGGRLVDPIRATSRAAARAGLTLLDHVILAHLVPSAPALSAEVGVASAPVWAHADLLVFANPEAAQGAAQ